MAQTAGIILQAAGGVIGGTGQILGGIHERKVLRRIARRVEQVGEQDRKEMERRGLKLRGAQRAAFAAAGVRPGEGSAFEVIAETAEDIRLNILRQKFNTDFRTKMLRAQGNMAAIAGVLGGVTTILGGTGGAIRDLKFGEKAPPLFTGESFTTENQPVPNLGPRDMIA